MAFNHPCSHYHYLVGVLLCCLFLLSGCTNITSEYYGIHVDLLSDDEVANITHPFVNITHLDFNNLPTLYQAIKFLIDPSTNKSNVMLETPKEEWNRIQSAINGSYFTYFRYYFSIGYAIS